MILDLTILVAFVAAMFKWNFGVLKLPAFILLVTMECMIWLEPSPIMHLLVAACFSAGYLLQNRRNTMILAPYIIMIAYQIMYAIYSYSTAYAGFFYYTHAYMVTFIYSLFIYTSYRCRFVRDSITTNDSRRRSLTARYNPVSANEARTEEGF